MPKVSVIIPVYNVEKYLKQCLDSVVNQTLQDIEIICINDGSTDNSLEILKKYAIDHSNFIILDIKNCGPGGARNKGLNIAQGDFIYFLDPDDWIELNALELMYNQAINTKAQIVLSGETLYIEDKQSYATGWRNFYGYDPIDGISEDFFYKTFTPVCTRLYKRQFIEKYNLRFVENCFYEDNSWGCLIALLVEKVSFVKNIYFYRRRRGATTNQKDTKVFDWIKDYKYFKNFIKEHKIESDKLYLAESWYLLNFYSYYLALLENNKEIFYKKIIEIINEMQINYDTIYHLSFLSKHDKRRLCIFYGYLLSKKFNNKIIFYKTNKNFIKIHLGGISK